MNLDVATVHKMLACLYIYDEIRLPACLKGSDMLHLELISLKLEDIFFFHRRTFRYSKYYETLIVTNKWPGS